MSVSLGSFTSRSNRDTEAGRQADKQADRQTESTTEANGFFGAGTNHSMALQRLAESWSLQSR